MTLITKVGQSLLGFVLGLIAVALLSHIGGCSERRSEAANVTPAQFATGAACIPTECSVVAGDNPIDVLR